MRKDQVQNAQVEGMKVVKDVKAPKSAPFMKAENKRKNGPKRYSQAGKTGLVLDLGKNCDRCKESFLEHNS